MNSLNDNPLVSIIVRTKDRPKLLKRALQSIADQTYRPLEVVLVNDGGCDLPVEELKGILGDVSLNYQCLKENRGRSHAGNVGIENAQGEFIGFLDDDDLFYENHVALLAGFLRESDIKVAYTDAYIVRNKSNVSGYQSVSREATYARDFDRDWLLFQNYIPLLCTMVRKELLNKEFFDTAFDLFEDWDLLIRLSRHTPFNRIAEITAEYHLRDDNTVLELHPETFPHIEARYKVYRKHMGLVKERSLSIFELLLSEKERYRELSLVREGELQKAKMFIEEKEKELERARAYINDKEAEVKQYLPDTAGTISVIILTHNGEHYIKELLDAIFTQKIDLPMEVIMVDSSSEDSTRTIAGAYKNVKVHVIDKTSFSHPGTRNAGVALSTGKYIVMITQDALPIGDLWLNELIRPCRTIPHLAASYSRQIPRPGCNPLEAKDIYTGAPCFDEIRYADLDNDWQRNDYYNNIHRYIRFSNVSSCYQADLLKNNPFREGLAMVEDQEWSKRMIENGYTIYYASKSVVMHSHNFSIMQIYRRYFDYGSSFKKFLFNTPPRRIASLKATLFDSINDTLYILNDRRRLRSKLKWICRSPLTRFAANYGLYKGWKYG